VDIGVSPRPLVPAVRTPDWCRKTAEEVGPACVEVIAALAEGGVMYKLRQAQGILGMRDKHTPDRPEAACRKALDAGDPSYRTIKGILALGAEADPVRRPAGDGGAAAFLHGPSLLFGDALTVPTPHEQTGTPTASVSGDPAEQAAG
jgi:hypothetical protein